MGIMKPYLSPNGLERGREGGREGKGGGVVAGKSMSTDDAVDILCKIRY